MNTKKNSSKVHGAIAMIAAVMLLGGLAACSSDSGSDSSGVGPETIGSGDTYQATIVRTSGGVPHVTGESLPDASFGQGYASGQDRTCDLADQIVKIRGERAKYLGAGEEDANLNSDIQWLTIGIFDTASQDWENLNPESQELFEAFAAGWNTHLEEVGVARIAGWCAEETWVRPIEPVEVYSYARAIALSASGSRVGAFIPTAKPPTSSDAPANARSPRTDVAPGATTTAAPTGNVGGLADSPIASNGWAVGSERSADGGGLLLANPHFPWEGELRFWEVQLTVPGEVDIYGAQLSGVPGIGIGFTENFGWTHTVSAGNRFTAYSLDLVEGSPTTYVYGEETKEMESKDFEIEVLGEDGEPTTVTHTSWYSHYGPILDFPGFGWTNEATITYRDANTDNDEFVEQYFAQLKAKNLDEFKQSQEEINGVPLFNTVAVSADGQAWYADTSATPNLSDEALAAYEVALDADPITQVAAENGAILLDGSDPVYEWVDAPGARDPGLVPAADQPQVERDDYVFNANDSFWTPHATDLLAGDYSPLHGRQETPRSPRTRENATVLDDSTAEGASGEDGFTLDELADASLTNEGYMARALLTDVVARCSGAPVITLTDVAGEDDVPGLPAGKVDLTEACAVLADWDGIYDLDRAGAALWREFVSRYEYSDLLNAGPLWSEPFDPAAPLTTPSGLATDTANEFTANDPVLENLARGVQALDAAGFPVDITLGEAQFSMRNGTRIPIHGGNGYDGTTNVIGYGLSASILDPALAEMKRERLVDGSSLSRLDGETGYPINNGTSFLMALAYTADGPQAKVFLTYSDTEDRTAANYTEATQAFSDKAWRTVAFTPADIESDATSTVVVKG